MLIKPDIEDEKIIACLQAEYGLRIHQLDFLPVGGDQCSAVYRALAEDETAYFCKLRCSDFDELSVTLPKFLSDQGIPQIIPSLLTQNRRLWAVLGAFRLIVFPYIEGTNGFEIELVENQWAEFGPALKRIHTTRLPEAIRGQMRKETFSPEWRDMCRGFLERLEHETINDPVTAELAAYIAPRRETILDLIGRAEQLAQNLRAQSPELVLCHSDIHPGNLYIDIQGTLFIVDWDYPILAPKECDLMFIGGGQGYMNTTAEQEEAYFYRYYGQPDIHPVAMAYYRCERNLVDLSVECSRIFSSTLSDQDRAQSLQIITWLFLPGGSIEMAYKSG